MLDLNRIPHPKEMICRPEGASVLLFDPSTGNIKVANDTGYLIWQWCDGQRSLAEILGLLMDSYPEVPPEQLELDLRSFFEDLDRDGLVAF